MSDRSEHNQAPLTAKRNKWFEEARIVDDEWIELTVTNSDGETVLYWVPRRTLFQDLDELAETAVR